MVNYPIRGLGFIWKAPLNGRFMLLKLIVFIVVVVSSSILYRAHNQITDLGDDVVQINSNQNLITKEKPMTDSEREKLLVKNMASFLESKPFQDRKHVVDVNRYIENSGFDEYKNDIKHFTPEGEHGEAIAQVLTLKINAADETSLTYYMQDSVNFLNNQPGKSAEAIVETFNNLQEDQFAEKLHLVELSRDLASDEEAKKILNPILLNYELGEIQSEDEYEF